MGENIYMLPGDMNLKKPRTVGYNNKILVSNSKFNFGKNDKVNTLELTKKAAIKGHKVIAQSTATQGLPPALLPCTDLAQKPAITHDEGKAVAILFRTGAFTTWYMFH